MLAHTHIHTQNANDLQSESYSTITNGGLDQVHLNRIAFHKPQDNDNKRAMGENKNIDSDTINQRGNQLD